MMFTNSPLAALALTLIAICSVRAQFNISQDIIKEPNIAGAWYPGKRDPLKKRLKKLNADAQQLYGDIITSKKERIRALVVPHAAYSFSGTVAAAAFRLLRKQKKIDKIIILGPSHFTQFHGVALPHFDYYRTPLGLTKIESNAIESLKRITLFHEQPKAFTPEHSIEAVLPFIAFFTHHIPVVPLVVGTLSAPELELVAKTLKQLITPKTVVIVSTDMIHYGTSFNYTPFKQHVLWNIYQRDAALLNALQQGDLAHFKTLIETTKATVCGTAPLEILMQLLALNALGPCRLHCIAYDTSEHNALSLTIDADKPPKTLVTYAGLVALQDSAVREVTTFEKRLLLQYARTTLARAFHPKKIPAKLIQPITTELLNQPSGVFVTLYTREGNKKVFRGCIGNTTSEKPLCENVAAMAQAAAFKDPRFSPLKEQELAHVKIEISILKPAREVGSYDDIILHEQGIILTADEKSALFLPEVPEEFGFDLEQTLTELSLKAGLAGDRWTKPGVKLEVFETISFSDEDYS